jgi:hypothetical protein
MLSDVWEIWWLYFYLCKEVTKGKGEAAEGGLPSKAELKKTIIGILKKVDFNTVGYILLILISPFYYLVSVYVPVLLLFPKYSSYFSISNVNLYSCIARRLLSLLFWLL